MHTRRNVVATMALCSLFMTAWLLPEAAASEKAREPVRPLAEMAIGASRIDWQPAGDSGRLTLTVAGPEGFWLRKEFEAGQSAFLSLFDDNGQKLPDGTYTYELRPVSGLDQESRERPLVQSGHFSIRNGNFVTAAPKPPLRNITANLSDDDLVIDGFACIGDSCDNTNDNDFPVLKLKGENPNILFDDVEPPPSLLSSSFNDWAIRINASDVASFSIFDFDGGLTPFSILGGAPDNSLFIRDNGNVGIGTATPAARLEVSGGEVRLPPGQGGTGFTHFNLSGNGQNYIRGTTVLADNGGNVGIGTTTPAAKLEVSGGEVRFPPGAGAAGFTHFNFTFDGKNYIRGTTIIADNGGSVGIGTTAPSSKLHVNGGDIRVSGGSFIDDGTTLNVPDYVFEPHYKLMPLDELRKFVSREKHLPNVPSANDVKKEGLNLSQVQMRLLEKVEELTLYTLKQDEQVKALQSENAKLNARLQALEQASATEQQ
jgi:hypothetical protein